jgi:hypothetical protein
MHKVRQAHDRMRCVELCNAAVGSIHSMLTVTGVYAKDCMQERLSVHSLQEAA